MNVFLSSKPISKNTKLAGRRVYADLSGATSREERVASWMEAELVEETGAAAITLESAGYDWRKFETAEAVRQAAEKVQAVGQHNLVAEQGLPCWWLVDSEGNPLGVNGLASIAKALKLAKELSVDTTEMTEKYSATDVISVALPKLIELKEARVAKAEKPQAKRPSKGERIRARREASLAKAEAARQATEEAKASMRAKPTASKPMTEAPKPQPRETEADRRARFAAQKATMRKTKRTENGDIHLCAGKRCKTYAAAEDMVVENHGTVKRVLDREPTEVDLLDFAYCPSCASRVFSRGGGAQLSVAIKACREVKYGIGRGGKGKPQQRKPTEEASADQLAYLASMVGIGLNGNSDDSGNTVFAELLKGITLD